MHVKAGHDDPGGIFRRSEYIRVNEGDPTNIINVQIDAGNIVNKIVGGRTEPKDGYIKAKLDITIQDDMGNERNHQLSIVAPIGLEMLPHRNWICIDFGTSAIAAAIGAGNDTYLLPLQKIVSDDDESLNIMDYDPANLEADTNFLPSFIICNADLRQDEPENDRIRKGFPAYSPASLKPDAPDFIGLPATYANLRDYPERIIHSLKSWLAQPTGYISLQDSIKFIDNGKEVERNKLPLEKLVQSGFSALASAYITALPEFHEGGQIVISYPNTFSTYHQEKLHDIAWKALCKPLDIALPEHIQLISESDAVAYHYCRQRMNKNKYVTGSERLLVFDFGAGMLDLSLVHINWSKEGTRPEQWQVENRLGVPVAGNYLDSLLARLIHELLNDESVLDSNKFKYEYPLVAKQLHGEQTIHRRAAYNLWQNIREAKIGWDGKAIFCVMVGKRGRTDLIVSIQASQETDNEVEKSSPEDDISDTEKPFLEVVERDGGAINLYIPAAYVHKYPPLKKYIEFVTNDIIDILLKGAGVGIKDVNTVIVSGRGALWAKPSKRGEHDMGMRERVWNKFSHLSDIDKPDLADGNEVKNAVVSGGIAWQQLIKEVRPAEPKVRPRLGILREQDQILTLEEDWEKGPIDLSSTDTFRLVQVSLENPNPRQDFKSLRRYFYSNLALMRRIWGWEDDPRLFVRKDGNDVRMENAQGQGFDFTAIGSVGAVSSVPPWPIGTILLNPDEESI